MCCISPAFLPCNTSVISTHLLFSLGSCCQTCRGHETQTHGVTIAMISQYNTRHIKIFTGIITYNKMWHSYSHYTLASLGGLSRHLTTFSNPLNWVLFFPKRSSKKEELNLWVVTYCFVTQLRNSSLCALFVVWLSSNASVTESSSAAWEGKKHWKSYAHRSSIEPSS